MFMKYQVVGLNKIFRQQKHTVWQNYPKNGANKIIFFGACKHHPVTRT